MIGYLNKTLSRRKDSLRPKPGNEAAITLAGMSGHFVAWTMLMFHLCSAMTAEIVLLVLLYPSHTVTLYDVDSL